MADKNTFRDRTRDRRRAPARLCAHSAAALVLAASFCVPALHSAATTGESVALSPPGPTGPYTVGRSDVHLTDPSRGHPWVESAEERELMASLWYPAEAGSGAEPAPYLTPGMADALVSGLYGSGVPRGAIDTEGSTANALADAPVAEGASGLPVLLFSPGFGESRFNSTADPEELASHGYLVVAMDHPYESTAVDMPDGRVLRQAYPERETPTYREAISVRTQDTLFVLDALEEGTLLPGPLDEAADTSTVGMFGHSAGGLTAGEIMVDDERIAAGVNLDGSVAYHVGDEEWARSTTHGVDRPFAYMGAGTSGADLPHHSGHHEDLRLFRAASSGPFHEVFMAEGEHRSFADDQWALPALEDEHGLSGRSWENRKGGIGHVDPEGSIAAQRAYLRAFFDTYLRGADDPLVHDPSGEHPELEPVE
ncbi:alpha/beta hydrolase [Nocardiopsis sp. HNM0947]|uniref:Alpha/beta hydrolase n=1 Tax=Nocardiopsis coralli TaxID=2772213 RepID=A0ABR9P9B6_9ACTN|nr:alpha/beta hydrolase [Nocardiopsis coralli]MBE3000429.1 alpha/beta hydrolase [Nocardiopsis coralli]